MTLDQRVTALEDAVRKLGVLLVADIDGSRATDAEVARQGRWQAHDGAGWHAASGAER